LLVSILMPSLNQAKKLAKCTMCKSNLFNIGTAICQYADEYNEQLPPIYGGQQNCCAYWFYYGDFRNIGLLARAGFYDCQSDVFICPSFAADAGFANSYGNHAHGNCVWGSQLASGDAYLSWTHRRSYYRRQVDDDGNNIVTLLDLGTQAWLGDVFVYSAQVAVDHESGVNVWYGDGHVEYDKIDTPLLDEISSSGSWQNVWDVLVVR